MVIGTQTSLFADPTIAPVPSIPGLNYIPEYISAQQENELIYIIDAQPWITELKRRVQHYGWRYDYKARDIAAK